MIMKKLLYVICACMVFFGGCLAESPGEMARQLLMTSLPLNSGGFFRCTSVAISPTILLSSGHCIADDMDVAGDPVVSFVVPNPDDDIAIVQVKNPLKHVYIYDKFSDHKLVYGDKLILVGLGCRFENYTDYFERIPHMSTLTFVTFTSEGDIVTNGKACDGDSGSPILYEGRLIGIAWGKSNTQVHIIPVSKL